jgi:hypothetical protein
MIRPRPTPRLATGRTADRPREARLEVGGLDDGREEAGVGRMIGGRESHSGGPTRAVIASVRDLARPDHSVAVHAFPNTMSATYIVRV